MNFLAYSFILLIDDLSNIIKLPVILRIFVDYINISLNSNDPYVAQNLLQKTVDDIENRINENRLSFSLNKIYCMNFTHKIKN